MLILNGENLGQRQKDLNLKINEAVKSSVEVKLLKSDSKELDADVLFKIDLAAKTKNIDYIIETLKCGDELYISRALKKCEWLGDKEFEDIINVNYLKQYVFPVMSNRMKKKLLCTLQFYLKNDQLITEFYTYCFENKLLNEASKFLLLAPESFKLQVIQKHNGLPNFNGYTVNRDFMKDFFKDSFTLLEKYLQIVSADEYKENYKHAALTSYRHMYSKSELKYLYLMETYEATPNLGKRTSKHILKKYKTRVLRYPEVYLNSLNKSLTIKHSSVKDAKTYSVALFEKYKANEFVDYYRKYKYIIEIIPKGERFPFMKNIFHVKYPKEPFEIDRMFYDTLLYEMMSETEREEWALCHIQSGDEILGADNDYLWYQFVNFEKAFAPIKKYVELTPDRGNRLNILKVLIDSVRSQKDIEVLLNHFYARHVNEMQNCKEHFLDTLISKHDVLEFNKNCWTALEKIFYSLDVFNKQRIYSCNSNYRHLALLHYVIHNEQVPDILIEYIDMDAYYIYSLKEFTKTQEQNDLIYDYLLKFYLKKLEDFKSKPYTEVKDEITTKANNVFSLLLTYEKTKDDVPEIIYHFAKLDPKSVSHDILVHFGILKEEETVNKLTENDIKRYLKQDATLVVSEFPKIKEIINRKQAPITWVLRKLGIYFATDLAPQFLNLLVECLSDDEILMRLAKTVVQGIYVLGEEKFKTDFLEKHVPAEDKIDHVNISVKQLNIQKAICGLVFYSRPHIPLKEFLPFMVGDYIHFCLPVLNAYQMRLPLPQFTVFVESILDKPVSIQKHGIRLAFKCFTTEYLVQVVKKAWSKSKNVSMRKITYETLFEKTVAESGANQTELFELLKKLTSDLNQDDDDDVFNLIWSSKLPQHLDVELLIIGWNTVSNFKKISKNVKRLTSVVCGIRNKIEIIPDEVIDLILNPHLDEFLKFEEPPEKPYELLDLREELQNLMRTYVLYFRNSEHLQKRIQIINRILKSCFKLWDKKLKEESIVVQFFYRFVSFLGRESSLNLVSHRLGAQYMHGVNSIFEEILKQTIVALPENEVYLFIWELRLTILTVKINAENLETHEPSDQKELEELCKKAVLKLAIDVSELIKEYISLDKYNHLFRESINRSIDYKVHAVMCAITDYYTDIARFGSDTSFKFTSSEAIIVFCKHLLTYNNREMNFLVVHLLTVYNNDYYKDEYLDVLDTLKSIKDDELQQYVYHKFVYNSSEYMSSYFSI